MNKNAINRSFVAMLALLFAGNGVASEWHPEVACGEGFDNVASLQGNGWIFANESEPLGSTGWFQGIPSRFPSQSGVDDSYISADSENASGAFPVVSNWLITPTLTFAPGNTLSFYTRELDGIGEAANRLQILLCMDGEGPDCTLVGPESGDVNGYLTDLLDVNPDEMAHGYPSVWTQYTITPAMGLRESGTGRIAFRYYTFAQSDGTWGTTIGIDTLAITSSAPCALGDSDTIFGDGFDG
jgi:hypothetical protein